MSVVYNPVLNRDYTSPLAGDNKLLKDDYANLVPETNYTAAYTATDMSVAEKQTQPVNITVSDYKTYVNDRMISTFSMKN